LTLDLTPLLGLGGANRPEEKYELMSILIHKGSSASHGHYGMENCSSVMQEFSSIFLCFLQ
jgi:uncharacterized UBP type Zn finger protein